MERKRANQQSDKELLKELASKDDVYSLIFVGPPGTGKTSACKLFSSTYLGIPIDRVDSSADYQQWNCSGDGGIDVMRDQVEPYAKGPVNNDKGKRKICVLEEAAGLTQAAMHQLKDTTERYSYNCIFIYCMNMGEDLKKFDDALVSRSTVFHFDPISFPQFDEWVQFACKELDVKLGDNISKKLYKFYKGDLRKTISDCLALFVGKSLLAWEPTPTYAEEIYNAKNPVEKYLEIASKTYIEPSKLLEDLFELNKYQCPEIFLESANALRVVPTIPIVNVLARGLKKN